MKTTELLQSFIDAYDALQSSDGASVYLDAESSRTFTVGHWLGQRMAGLVDEAKMLLESEQLAAELNQLAGTIGSGEDDDIDERESLVCAICGNKQIAPMNEIIDAGWIPEFWYDDEGDCGVDGPACPGCVEHRIDWDGDEPMLMDKEDWTR